MLAKLQKKPHWPQVKMPEWLALYEKLFSVKLAQKTAGHDRLRRMIENAKEQYRKKYPFSGGPDHQAAVEMMREIPQFRSSSQEAL